MGHHLPLLKFMKSALVALFFSAAMLASSVFAAEIFAREPLSIVHKDGTRTALNVELALTGPQREQGLMFRRSMGENEGMLFDFAETRPVFMWMKATVLPLDMVFIKEDGTINHIHENAVPFSEAIISSADPVRYVLELNAGAVAKFGIREGDRAESQQIGNLH